MAAKWFGSIGLMVLLLTASATITAAQNTNPITSLTLPQQRELAVSPSTPGTTPGSLSGETSGTNPITGLPCSGQGSLAVSGAGALPDVATPPPDETSATPQLPSAASVFGPQTTLGSC
jgi:hypothetical protein